MTGRHILLPFAGEEDRPKVFSICMMVTDWKLYERARHAYEQMGFSSDLCEFLVADNSGANNFSAFDAVRGFMRLACGAYVLIAHEDVLPLEPACKLLQRIGELTRHDRMWGVIGNAGVGAETGRGSARSLSDPSGSHQLTRSFVSVSSLDENVMIVRGGSGITASADMSGYHLYAHDVCSIARRLGYTCYVLDYMWRHESNGSIGADFLDARDRMEAKMRAAGTPCVNYTMCTAVSARGGSLIQWSSAVRSLWMLRNDLPERLVGYKLLLERSARRWPLFPLIYHPLTFARAILETMTTTFERLVVRRLAGVLKIAGWHYEWWRRNWRSRLFPGKSDGNE